MSYHKFSNLRSKQETHGWNHISGLYGSTLQLQPCIKDQWEMCLQRRVQEMCVVYKATCRVCDESYIGQTQQKLKDRIGQHLNDVKKLITKGIKSDSFTSHFANHCKKETKPTNDELRRMMKVKIIWQGNAISCMKSFGKLNCSLCMSERIDARESKFCARFVKKNGRSSTPAMKSMVHAGKKQGFTGSLTSTQT